MKRTVLMTGATGFIGRRLAGRLLEKAPGTNLVLLVQRKFEESAQRDVAAWRSLDCARDSQLDVVIGDITDAKLGLTPEEYADLSRRVTEVWHLAAIYDLAVPFEFAKRVNVDGTQHVLGFCRACKGFQRLVYFSTSYVSGNRTGLILESELIEGQGFKNHYESTKFAAEVLVRRAIDDGLPGLVIRPGIVVGDSRSGETDKFDGPYFGMQFIYTLRWLPIPLPRPGASDAEVNLVPIDYLVDVTVALASKKDALGGTYQVVDPNPLMAKELYDELCRTITGKASWGEVPAKVLEAALGVPQLRKLFGTPKEVIVYFNHKAKFDTTKTLKMLEGTGVSCPDMRTYLRTLFEYWDQHRGQAGFEAKA